MSQDNLFGILGELRQTHKPFGPLVDEAALLVAQRCREEIGHYAIALTWHDWSRLTASLQCQIATVLRHAVFEKPDFPAGRFEEGTD